jgi:oligopeptide/dipeptide ABC transporter ATP-binding protein
MESNGKQPLIRVENLSKHFPTRRGLFQRTNNWIKAVDGISFNIYEGETLGLVGESGSGKTTAGLSILRLIEANHGTVFFGDTDVYATNRKQLRRLRREMQIIFQDPFSSLDPRIPVGDSIGEGLIAHGIKNAMERRDLIDETLHLVGLEEYHARRFPHEFSGGQRQRIGIARAIALRPKFVVCDEPVSALDVSIQSQIINLLRKLQQEIHLTYLFIAHNLNIVEYISNRVGVMYLGKLMEIAERKQLYQNPLHPYTQALLSAIPIPDPELIPKRILLSGEIPSLLDPPRGCRFHPRCPYVMPNCCEAKPEMVEITADHWVACFLVA